MPRPETHSTTATTADAEGGYAALEAKVEEVQTEAAIEAELSKEDEALAPALVSLAIPPGPEPAKRSEASGASTGLASPPLPGGRLAAAYQALADWTLAAMEAQTEVMASFASARGPRDLLEAQIAYGQRMQKIYFDGFARLASPTIAGLTPGR